MGDSGSKSTSSLTSLIGKLHLSAKVLGMVVTGSLAVILLISVTLNVLNAVGISLFNGEDRTVIESVIGGSLVAGQQLDATGQHLGEILHFFAMPTTSDLNRGSNERKLLAILTQNADDISLIIPDGLLRDEDPDRELRKTFTLGYQTKRRHIVNTQFEFDVIRSLPDLVLCGTDLNLSSFKLSRIDVCNIGTRFANANIAIGLSDGNEPIKWTKQAVSAAGVIDVKGKLEVPLSGNIEGIKVVFIDFENVVDESDEGNCFNLINKKQIDCPS